MTDDTNVIAPVEVEESTTTAPVIEETTPTVEVAPETNGNVTLVAKPEHHGILERLKLLLEKDYAKVEAWIAEEEAKF